MFLRNEIQDEDLLRRQEMMIRWWAERPCEGQTYSNKDQRQWFKRYARPGLVVVLKFTRGHFLEYLPSRIEELRMNRVTVTRFGQFSFNGRGLYEAKDEIHMLVPRPSLLRAAFAGYSVSLIGPGQISRSTYLHALPDGARETMIRPALEQTEELFDVDLSAVAIPN